jgi:hypothetical protein
MKTVAYALLILLALAVVSCEDKKVDTELQNAQDLVKGEWVLSDVSAELIPELASEQLANAVFSFRPCDIRQTDGKNRLCTGQAIIKGTTYNTFYYNSPAENIFQLTVLLEPPYSTIERAVITGFSGNYTLETTGNSIRYILKNRGNAINSNRGISFTLTRK